MPIIMLSEFLETESKQGKRILCFNTLVDSVVLLGCRIMSGQIYPPQTLRRGRYYDVNYLTDDAALALYDALALKLEGVGQRKLLHVDKQKATAKLLGGEKLYIFFPSLAAVE